MHAQAFIVLEYPVQQFEGWPPLDPPFAVQAPHVVVPLAHKEAGYLSLVQRTMTRCIVRAVDVGLLADTRWIARGRAAPRPWPLLVSVCWLLWCVQYVC